MDFKHLSKDETKEFFTEERCHILELLNESDDRSQSIARARVEAGITTAWHRLKNTSESFYFLEGKGVLEIGEDQRIEIQAGDTVRIPENTAQRLTNTEGEDLIFLCFCVPAFSDESYEVLE